MRRLKEFINLNRNDSLLLTSTNTISTSKNDNKKEDNLEYESDTEVDYTNTQSNFFQEKPFIDNHPSFEDVFKNNSYEIFQFLENRDIENLRRTNKFFCDICDCYYLFDNSIQSLGKLFAMSLNNENNNDSKNNKIVAKDKKSKFIEKFNFNQSVDKYYKNTEEYYQRIKSAKKNKKIKKKK